MLGLSATPNIPHTLYIKHFQQIDVRCLDFLIKKCKQKASFSDKIIIFAQTNKRNE
jgi:hypothetical protein